MRFSDGSGLKVVGGKLVASWTWKCPCEPATVERIDGDKRCKLCGKGSEAAESL